MQFFNRNSNRQTTVSKQPERSEPPSRTSRLSAFLRSNKRTLTSSGGTLPVPETSKDGSISEVRKPLEPHSLKASDIQFATPSTLSNISQRHAGTSATTNRSDFEHISHDLPSSAASRANIRLHQELSRPSTPTKNPKPAREGLLSATLPAKLVVSCDNGQEAAPLDCVLSWQNVNEWHEFWRKAELRLEQYGKYSRGDESTRLYLQSGSAYIICAESEGDRRSCFLENQGDWAVQLQRMITTFVLNSTAKFEVEIRWNFAILSLPFDNAGSLKDSIRTAISTHSEKNWENKSFIPRKVLDAIFTSENVLNVISNESSLDSVDFQERGAPWSSRATFAGADLLCLYHLLKNCPNGGPFPAVDRPLEERDRPKDANVADFEQLCEMQSRFKTHTFRTDPKNRVSTHEKLDANVVVPILNEQQGHNKKEYLGGGAFGDVYRVKIHSGHHKFSSNRAEVYALKVFRDDRYAGGDDFRAEEAALRRLATKPHPNLVIHLAAWTQHQKFYMLFPCARENLRQYLSRTAPNSSAKFVCNLLQQIRDLSSAVEHIHRLAPGGLGNPAGDTLVVKSGHHRSTALHYDLKPENVLLFPGTDEGRDIWKISDFGTARIHDIMTSRSGPLPENHPSHKTKTLVKGDPLYGAPDYVIKGETSRPYDVWSLGCILLEILLWAYQSDYWHKQVFADERLESPSLSGNQSQAFWYEDGSHVGLKPLVIELIETLRDSCDGWGVIPELVNMVPAMLRLIPEQRPQAAVIRSNIDSLLFQADVDLEDEPELYDKPRGRNGKQLAAVPSNNGSRSRGGSIDRQVIEIPRRLREDSRTPRQRPSHRYTSSGYRAADAESAVRDVGQHLAAIDTNVSARPSRSRSPSINVRSPDGKYTTEHEGTAVEEVSPLLRRTEFSSEDLVYQQP